MSIDIGGLRVPTIAPLTTSFEDYVSYMISPIAVLARTIGQMEEAGGRDKALAEIGWVLEGFLEQLEYLIDHSFIEDKNIAFAEVKHPFKIVPDNIPSVSTKLPKKMVNA